MNSSSNVFGQSSNNPTGPPSVFGQKNNSNNNQFAATPFGGMYTNVFSTQTFSPVISAPSAPSFGGSSSLSSHGSSVYGQNTASGVFGTTTQSSSVGFSFPQSQPAFGTTDSWPFGSSTQPAIATSTPTFCFNQPLSASTTPAFGDTSSSYSIGSTPTSGQSTPAFVSSPFGSTTTGFGFPNSPFGGLTAVREPDGTLVSISAIPAYKDKSHEELRWDNYYLKYLGSRNRAACECCKKRFNINSNTQDTNPSANSSPAFGQPSTNPFAPKTTTFSSATSAPYFSTLSPAPSMFKSTPSATSNIFFSTPWPEPSVFKSTPSATSSPYFSTSSPAPSVFKSTPSFAFPPSNPVFDTQAKGTTSASGGSNTASGTMDFKMNNTQQTFSFSSSPAAGQSSANTFSFTISTNPFDPKTTSTFGTPGIESSTPSLGSSPSTLVLVFNFKNMDLT